MPPLDRRHFLRRMLAVLALPIVGCAETDEPPGEAAPTPGRQPSPEPTTDAAADRPAPPSAEPSAERPGETSPPVAEASPEPPSEPSPEPPPEPSPESSIEPEAPAAEPEPASPPAEEEPGSTGGAVTLTVICRAAWGARPAGELSSHTVRQMTLHHTAVALRDDRDAPGRLRQHQRYHQSLGWPDIAYHLGIDRRGNVYELRRPDAPGDTSTDYDPAGHFLVVAEGDYSQQEPTVPQLESIARAFAWGARTFGVDPSLLSGHRDHASTACPGDALQRRIPELRQRVSELLAAGIERHDVCGVEGAERVDEIESGG